MSENNASEASTKKSGKKGTFVAKLKAWAIGLLMGAVLGIAGLLFFQHYNPVDVKSAPEIVAASTVFERIVSENELVCASQKYNITEKAVTTNKTPFTDLSVPFTDSSYWYRYIGTLKVSVDLSTATFEQDGTNIIVTLNEPYFSSNTPDMDKSQVLEQHNNVFNPIDISEFDAFKSECMKQSEVEALEGGIIEEAKANAEDNIQNMFFAALGEGYTVEVRWADAPAE